MAKRRNKPPSATTADRLKRCRTAMRKAKIAGYLITNRRDAYYLTGFTGEDSAVLITPRQVHVISDGRFDQVIDEECPWAKKWLRRGLLIDEIGKVCVQIGLGSVAVQADHLSVEDHATLKKHKPRIKLTIAPPICATMRRIKDRTELSKLNKALRIAEDAFQATLASIRIGQTELEMAARLEYEMKKRGASQPAFPTICAEGANAALPHALPGARRVKPGSAVLFDWGARSEFYCSDLTRMVFIGSIPPKVGEWYAVVLEAQEIAIDAIKPGARMCDVDRAARDHIAAAGYGKAFMHGLGHGLGLDVHEPPSLSWRSNEPLVAGMVVTVEPGIYVPGRGGVRIEDDVLVTPTGRRVLSRLAKDIGSAVIKARR